MFYRILETLTPAAPEEALAGKDKWAAVLKLDEWRALRDTIGMGIETDVEGETAVTKAEVNYDSLTGCVVLPALGALAGAPRSFSFALDERGVVFIDRDGSAAEIVERVRRAKRWRSPGLERFLYDVLEETIAGDLHYLEGCERKLNRMEDDVMADGDVTARINDLRGELLDLRTHYDRLMDLGQELAENENEFFDRDCLRYFHLFTDRVSRLQDMVLSQRDYIVQIRDLQKARLDARQNRIMTVLTVVTTVFLPLTLIVGWYGMNFRHMPELEWRWGYPAVILLSLLIIFGCLAYFKKKKWL